LALAFVDADGSSVQAEDVSNAVGDGEIFETSGRDNDSSEVVVFSLGYLLVEGGVNNFEAANIPAAHFVGESRIDNNTV